ncbi:MAG: DUF3995 domain-containing protein [Lachnospiraceae bacterium]|nr:DUF3995 domain-containing protein [Lachnospiraceae bacterium]
MEFVDGMTVCTDCGGPLVESKEVSDALMAEEAKKRQDELRHRYEELLAAEEAQVQAAAPQMQEKRASAPARAYVDKKQRSEDVASSATAFFLVGGILVAAAILCTAGVIPLPMQGSSRLLACAILAVMGLWCLYIGVTSRKTAALLKSEAAEEQKETEEILTWFERTYSPDDLDQQLLMEDPGLTGEELDLKRFELIQDYLVTARDLPDQSYTDALCDMIYARLYEHKRT